MFEQFPKGMNPTDNINLKDVIKKSSEEKLSERIKDENLSDSNCRGSEDLMDMYEKGAFD